MPTSSSAEPSIVITYQFGASAFPPSVRQKLMDHTWKYCVGIDVNIGITLLFQSLKVIVPTRPKSHCLASRTRFWALIPVDLDPLYILRRRALPFSCNRFLLLKLGLSDSDVRSTENDT